MADITLVKDVSFGEQFGKVTQTKEGQISLGLTSLRGTISLNEFRSLIREINDTEGRLNPVVHAIKKKKSRR
jgi:hypothetical protein